MLLMVYPIRGGNMLGRAHVGIAVARVCFPCATCKCTQGAVKYACSEEIPEPVDLEGALTNTHMLACHDAARDAHT